MNVELFARIKPTRYASDSQASSIRIRENTINAEDSRNGNSGQLSFSRVFPEASRTDQVYKSCAEPMIDLLISGYNVSLLFVGNQGSGRSYSLAGAGSNIRSGLEEREGIIQPLLSNIFRRVDEELGSSGQSDKEAQLFMTMVEMDAIGNLTDLITRKPGDLCVERTVYKGYAIKNSETRELFSLEDGLQTFKDSWRNRTQSDRRLSTLIIYIDLVMSFEEFPDPHKSRLSLVVMPSLDDMDDQSSEISKLDSIITSLASHPYADRVIDYKSSPITKLLSQELGGNCSTRVLALFQQNANIQTQLNLIRLCKNLSQVKNFPIQNDTFARQLISQYRATEINLDNRLINMEQDNRSLRARSNSRERNYPNNENARLRDDVQRLKAKLDSMNSTFGTIANNKSELSSQLMSSEEEKLKAHKAYIELQIINNKLKEDMESINYENTNRILTLEHELQLCQIDRNRYIKEVESVNSQFTLLEADRKSLFDELVKLKTSYMELTDDCQREANKNEELTMELLNLLNAKSALANLAQQNGSIKEEAAALIREQERIRGVLSKHSGPHMQAAKQMWSSQRLDNELLGNQARYYEQSEQLRLSYNDHTKKLEATIESLKKELKLARGISRERQQKVSFLNARIITLTGENEEIKTYNNRLQHKIKDMNEEYRMRLSQYVSDIASQVDTMRKGKNKEKTEESMAQYVNKLIKEVKASHKNREEQLSQAAQSYKTRTEKVIRRHEELLCAYRDLRQQTEEAGLDDLDLGPDEHELAMSDPDLQSSQQKEILRLEAELHRHKISRSNDEDDVPVPERSMPPAHPGILKNSKPISDDTFSDLNSWTAVRRQIRNFTQSSLRELEEERAELLSRNSLLEQQLQDAQSYIDNHLSRYREEVNKLRQQLASARR